MRALMEQRAQTRDKNKALIQMNEQTQEDAPKKKGSGKVGLNVSGKVKIKCTKRVPLCCLRTCFLKNSLSRTCQRHVA